MVAAVDGEGALTHRPILFSAPMVRALLDGRKTQTRRVLKPLPSQTKQWSPDFSKCPSARIASSADYDERWVAFEHPLGGPYTAIPLRPDIGDRLWVRETWKPHSIFVFMKPREIPKTRVFYDADNEYAPSNTPWVPSIHMPRWASRLTLTVTDVRVQRLQDISEADALAEGVEQHGRFFGLPDTDWDDAELTACAAFRRIWNSINGPDAWQANPWVVALTFDVEKRNIDQ